MHLSQINLICSLYLYLENQIILDYDSHLTSERIIFSHQKTENLLKTLFPLNNTLWKPRRHLSTKRRKNVIKRDKKNAELTWKTIVINLIYFFPPPTKETWEKLVKWRSRQRVKEYPARGGKAAKAASILNDKRCIIKLNFAHQDFVKWLLVL